MRPTGVDHAREARRVRGQALGSVLVDMDRLDDPATLAGDSIPAGLFWQVVAALATERGLKVRAPLPETEHEVIAAAVTEVRAARADRERVPGDKLFDAFKPWVVR